MLYVEKGKKGKEEKRRGREKGKKGKEEKRRGSLQVRVRRPHAIGGKLWPRQTML